MKKYFLFLIILAVFASCKTTEANYRKAYEIAKEKQQRNSAEIPEGITLNKYDQPKLTVIDGDTLMLLTDYSTFIKDGGLTRQNLKKYNIVVGQFKQLFNARQMMQRLKESGYPEAGIILNRQKDYLVVAMSVSAVDEAIKSIDKVNSDSTLVMRTPLPYVFQPVGY